MGKSILEYLCCMGKNQNPLKVDVVALNAFLSIFLASNVDNCPHGIHLFSVQPTEMPAGCMPMSGG